MPSNSVVKDTLVVGGLSLLGFLAGGKLGSMFGAVIGTIFCSLLNDERVLTPPEDPRPPSNHRETNHNRPINLTAFHNETMCTICLENFDPVIKLIPCQHVCFCLPCYNEAKKKNVSSCPICRETIETIIFC